MKVKLFYWTSTAILGLMMLGSAFAYFSSEALIQNFRSMGFPDFFRVELGIAKLLGVLVLLIPMVPRLLKEWAYAGFGITFISAFILHVSEGDPASKAIMPLFALCLLVVSRVFSAKL